VRKQKESGGLVSQLQQVEELKGLGPSIDQLY
jgi:hypothetical protein